MNTPLAGLGVLVTRPAHQAGRFIQLLEQAGARTWALPAIDIQPLPLSDEQRRQLPSRRYDLVIFISANAVRLGLPLLPDLEGVHIAALGQATARTLREQGITVDLVAGSDFTSEALLALPGMQAAALKNKRVLLVRGEGGREVLAETLPQRGAQLDALVVYKRVRPQADVSWLAPLWGTGLHLVSVTSNETLENLYHMLQDFRPQLLNTTLLVPGERGYALAQSLGFRHILQSNSASDQDMLQTLLNWYPKTHTGAT